MDKCHKCGEPCWPGKACMHGGQCQAGIDFSWVRQLGVPGFAGIVGYLAGQMYTEDPMMAFAAAVVSVLFAYTRVGRVIFLIILFGCGIALALALFDLSKMYR
ncbi:hypothetical protein D3C77_155800 [compost metagenome]